MQKVASSPVVIVLNPTFLDKLERCARAAGVLADDEVWGGLRELRRAARRLVIKPTENADVWQVGPEDSPEFYVPTGDYFPALCKLLACPHNPVPVETLVNGRSPRAIYAGVHRSAEDLAGRMQCFNFVAPSLHLTGKALMFEPAKASPVILV